VNGLRACAFALLVLCCVAPARAADVVDERVTLTPGGTCGAARRVFFAGRNATLEGASIKDAGGAVLYTGADRVLDAVSFEGTDYILTESSVVVRSGKKAAALPLGIRYASGRLLFARPNFLIYYVTSGQQTYFFTQTRARRLMYFAAGPDFVAARLDKFGNTIIADEGDVIAVNKQARVLPILKLRDDRATGLEVDASDNAIMLSTPKGLFKIPQNRKVYTLVSGAGSVESLNGRLYWCDAAGARYEMSGQTFVGQLASDKMYVHSLLAQGNKLLSLNLPEKAFQKFMKAYEIMPNEPNVRRLVFALGEKLYGKNAVPTGL
jgi:hypothetical protein